MSQEKIKILEMLKENIITTDEALKLLEQVGKEDPNESRFDNDGNGYEAFDGPRKIHHHNHMPRRPRPGRGFQANFDVDIDMDWVDDLRENVEESVKTVSDYIYQNYSPFDYMKPNNEISFVSEDILQDISSLKLYAKNSSCEVTGHGGKNIEIQAYYRTKGPRMPQITFEEENGHYTLNYDSSLISSMRLKVLVPNVRVNDLFVENKNSQIKITDIRAKNVTAITKSAHIKLEDIEAIDILAETKNGAIYLDNVGAQMLNLKTVNSKIDLDKVNADTANLITYNAAIKTKNCNIGKTTAKTKNAGIKLDNYRDIEALKMPISSIEAVTTNGPIGIEVPRTEEAAGINIKAATSFGSIDTDLKNLLINTVHNSYMDAKTTNYDQTQNKIDLFLNTSNGKINIKRR